MEYHGDLYAKIGRKYLKLKQTSKDYDSLESEVARLKGENEKLKKFISLWGHLDEDQANNIISEICCDRAEKDNLKSQLAKSQQRWQELRKWLGSYHQTLEDVQEKMTELEAQDES